jgi:hypothetical protein
MKRRPAARDGIGMGWRRIEGETGFDPDQQQDYGTTYVFHSQKFTI